MHNSTPWIEKYRPSELDDIIMDPNIKKIIDVLIHNRGNTHMIITGPPGIGKTSTVRCIARKILGINLENGFLELNDSDSRGVKNITSIIPSFCKRAVSFDESKIILLDESDNITSKCQADLCDMIKQFGHNTNFIFTCNDSSKIIENIQSICRIIRFKSLCDDQIKERLKKICEYEEVSQTEEGLNTICYISGGDMRKAINNLQITANSFNKITKKEVLSICKMPDPIEIASIIDLCLKKNFSDSNQKLNNLIMEGYYFLDIVVSFGYVVDRSEIHRLKTSELSPIRTGISNKIKLQLIDVINQTKIVLSTNVRSKLQLVAMLCRMIDVINKN